MSRLPDSPGDLIRDTVAALEECEADPRYAINMHHVHYYQTLPNGTNVCTVCFAGAAMAKRLGVDPTNSVLIADMPERWKLYALDDFRQGCVERALRYLDADDGYYRPRPSSPVRDYEADGPAEFKEDMLKLAERLDAELA